MSNSTVKNSLAQGLQALGIKPAAELQDKLLAYLQLLQKWNKAYNLTAVRDEQQMVYRHLLDSLAIAAHIPASVSQVVDVGSGAGLPGVPLALLYPQQQYHLVDSNGKKTRFLFQVKTALGLDNMTVHHVRAEEWAPPATFDIVLSRAFASLADMVTCCAHLCSPNGRFLAMKGTRPDIELAALAGLCEVHGVYSLQVPGLEEARHLVELGPLAKGEGKQLG